MTDHLPAAPLVSALREYALRNGGTDQAADDVNMQHASFYRLINHAEVVTVDLADRIAIALGTHPAEIWPVEWCDVEDSFEPCLGKARGCQCADHIEARRYARRLYDFARRQKDKEMRVS